MAFPTSPTLDYSYAAFEQSQGDSSFPGTSLDNDLLNLKQAIDEVIDFTSIAQRADGRLANGIVTKASLAEDVLLGLAAPRPWATATAYVVDDTITIGNSVYICVVVHTSGVFATDLAAAKWAAVVTFEIPTEITDGSVTTPKIADLAGTTAKIADLAVTTAKIADASVTLAKLHAGVGVVPIGAELDYAGWVAPSGWVLEAGQALPRSTFSALWDVIAPATIGVAAIGSATLTSVPVDFSTAGLEGAPIEGASVAPGTTIVSCTATTITLSAVATVNGSVGLRVYPFGRGDGSTTFNIPDGRGYATIGRGGMGGASAGRVTASGTGNPGLNSDRLGDVGGVDRHALTAPQLATHGHTASSSVTDPGHAHGPGTGNGFQNTSPGSVLHDYIGGSVQTATSAQTAPATTGVTVSTTVNDSGGDQAHPNLQPSRVTNKIIWTGVF